MIVQYNFKNQLRIALVCCMSIIGFGVHAQNPEDSTLFSLDSSAYVSDSLKDRFPNLWQRAEEIAERRLHRRLRRQDITTPPEKHIVDSLTTELIRRQTRYDTSRATEIDIRIKNEILYFKNKRSLDVARGKYFFMPYRLNYFCFTPIDDPSPEGLEPRDPRLALKWQLSFQVPLVAAKHYNTGIFAAFTNRGTFDLFNMKDSQPVTHKTFMPEFFGRLDLAFLFPKKERLADKYVLQLGYEHESNGGGDNLQSLLDSRGITAKFYGSTKLKFFLAPADEQLRYVYEDKYKLTIHPVFVFSMLGIDDNPDIDKYIGFFDLRGSYEQDLAIGSRCLGITRLDWSLIPGGKKDLSKFTYSLGLSYSLPMLGWTKTALKIPLTFYLRHFNGYNEYLYYYNVRRQSWLFGIRVRD